MGAEIRYSTESKAIGGSEGWEIDCISKSLESCKWQRRASFHGLNSFIFWLGHLKGMVHSAETALEDAKE